MESVEGFSRSPAKARLPDQAGEEPAAEVSLKPPGPPDEIPATAEELAAEMPSTAAELVAALFPLGDSLTGQKMGSAAGNRWLSRLQRLVLAAVRVRIRDKYK
jgi:hypothetical protein